ncbi:MAG: heavy metal-responsive transcriptional regulator [Nitrosomonas sp.]|jgi:DNA-binding transcriptional MerR regulator|uniref:MerR family transcriptional regulator, mercuric resistance operon regulatory protein n=1 Tax=Nitrosomonas aestuarii TaxID=52441 RepID=A0A1I4FKW3_9PROT|nr:heavy metal-responsive transcriptional regulator [Nitrosomonas aestuarii]MBX3630630.1 heavy metal-responsive transcriptional regulator [Nitrosomonas sp.]SFL17567.1 MerR family transcriptional regulator, mercuric resistance operon regulatory protein [Nitrosomonas aestuarii]
MLIGELAEKANVSVDTIRYYERESLIKPVSVRDSGYREFDERSVDTILFVVRAKDLGFSLKEICTLLRLKNDPDTTCGKVKVLAEKKITDVVAKIKNLQAIKKDLATLISKCTDTAASIDQCPIVGSLDKKEKEI